MSNLKQIGHALALYSSDNLYGVMPPMGPMGNPSNRGAPAGGNTANGGLFEGDGMGQARGVVPNPGVFLCPASDVQYPSAAGGGNGPCCYLRHDWDYPEIRPEVVIAGDYWANHWTGRGGHAYMLLFMDNRVVYHRPTLEGGSEASHQETVPEAHDPADRPYHGPEADSSVATWLHFND